MKAGCRHYDENELAEALDKYTTVGHPEYDPEFDKTIRALRPDWFVGEQNEGMEKGDEGDEQAYYWIAINHSSCAMCSVPMSGVPGVSPRPQGLIGFPTFVAAKAAQKLCLTAPIPVVEKAVMGWRAGKGGVRFVEYKNPERPQAQTHWILSNNEGGE
jgi:hypothetical protein